MNRKLWLSFSTFTFLVITFITALSTERLPALAQSNPIVETAVALTLTAFNQSLSTATLSVDQQIEATVNAALRKTVWIEDTLGEAHPFMKSLPVEIVAKDKVSADLWVVIAKTETQGKDLSVSGCGSVKRYQDDYVINLIDSKTKQVVDTRSLDGYIPNPFILSSCDPLHGKPSFENFFHWLALHAYLIATPTSTPSYTLAPSYTPIPTTTASATP